MNMKIKKSIAALGRKLLCTMIVLSMLAVNMPIRIARAAPDGLDNINTVFVEPDMSAERPITIAPFSSSLTPITVGSGTASDPYIIHTAGELAWLAEQVVVNWFYWGGLRYFTLANDIDISNFGRNWDNGRGWMPIGGLTISGDTRPFWGTFDGNGHTISGLYMNRPSLEDDVPMFVTHGLFGSVGGTIKNLRVEGTINNLRTSGGIAGELSGMYQRSGMIANSYFVGEIHSTHFAGGIVGAVGNASFGGIIRNSYSSGIITSGTSGAGGIAGRVSHPDSIIENNTSSAFVIGEEAAGGIVGMAFHRSVTPPQSNTQIINNTALNPFVQGGDFAGRVLGLRVPNVHFELYGNRALGSMFTNGGVAFPAPPEVYNVHNNLNGEDISGPVLVAGVTEGLPGEIVRIPVFLQNNPGIGGFNLVFSYDSNIVTPVALDDAAIRRDLGGSVFVSNIDNEAGTITVVWASPYDVDEAHLFYLYFAINYTAEKSINTPIRVSIVEMKQYSHDDVDALTQNGSIRTGPILQAGLLWGDVNQDGIVDIFDLIRLAQHIAGTPDMELTGDGLTVADVFYDGSVDLSDLIHLSRYLASEDMSNPDVVLGPGSRP